LTGEGKRSCKRAEVNLDRLRGGKDKNRGRLFRMGILAPFEEKKRSCKMSPIERVVMRKGSGTRPGRGRTGNADGKKRKVSFQEF